MELALIGVAVCLVIAFIVILILRYKSKDSEPYVPGYITTTGRPGEEKTKRVSQERLNTWLDTLPADRKRTYRKQQLAALTRRGWKVTVEPELTPTKAVQYRAKCFNPNGELVKEAVAAYADDVQYEVLP